MTSDIPMEKWIFPYYTMDEAEKQVVFMNFAGQGSIVFKGTVVAPRGKSHQYLPCITEPVRWQY